MEVKELIRAKDALEAYTFLNQFKGSKVMAGGAWMKLSVKSVDKLILLDDLNLDYIKEENEFLEIGAMTSLRTIEIHPAIKSLNSGILAKAIKSIMGVQVRNIATIGGSVMGRFAFSDILGALLVLDCRLYFHDLQEITVFDFLQMPKVPSDILLSIKIKKTAGKGYFHKVSKTHLDFSLLNIAITKNKLFKIAIGSRPQTATLAINTANFLNSQREFNEETIKKAVEIACDEIKVSTNLRASKEYREVLLKTYLTRGLEEVIK